MVIKNLFMLKKPTLLFILALCCLFSANAQRIFVNNMEYTSPHIPDAYDAPDPVLGTPLLLKTWAKGIVVNMNDSVINDSGLLMNFDKIAGELIVTRDKQNYLHTEKRDIKGFILYTDSGKLIFTKVPEINTKDFFQLLASGNTCTVYKKTSTVIKRGNYVSDGIAETGTRSSSYADNPTYYLANVNGKNKFSGKFYATKKSIQAAFGFDNDKLQQYFTLHKFEENDESFIIGLGSYFNRP